MILATIEGNLIFLVIAAIIGVINWISQKNKPADSGAPPRSPKSRAGSEEERMRKFMEALGIPVDQQPPPPVQRRAPAPTAPPLPTIKPSGPVLANGPFHVPPRKPPTPRTPPRLPTPPPALPVPMERPTVVEKTQLPELSVPVISSFDTMASHVTAIPFEASHADMRDAYKSPAEMPKAASETGIHSLLRSPRDLRAAIILREVLGPPRGLQSAESSPSFPSF